MLCVAAGVLPCWSTCDLPLCALVTDDVPVALAWPLLMHACEIYDVLSTACCLHMIFGFSIRTVASLLVLINTAL
jgi:hypothetical protein